MKVKYLLYLLIAAGSSLGLQGCLPDGPEPDKQFTGEVQLIDDYLRASFAEGVIYDQGYGIRFQILDHGDGPRPKPTEAIEGHHNGYLFNSSGVFPPFGNGVADDNLSDITPTGLAVIYSYLLEGSTAKVYIPSKYGFGVNGTTNVPANSTLVYTVTLDKVIKSSPEQTQFQLDTAKIKNYFESAEVAGFEEQRSGIFFKETFFGSGVTPNPYDIATIKYSLRLLGANGPSAEEIESGTLTDYPIFQLINGLQIGLQLLREGGKGTFYIPSYLGYGAKVSQDQKIPANSILIFDIEVVKITRQQ